MRVNFVDARKVTMMREQELVYGQRDFAAYFQWRLQQQVERSSDRTFGGILHRHHAITRTAGFHSAEYVIYRGAWQRRHHAPKALQRGFFRKGPLRAEVRYGQRFFHRSTQ